jgi:hypothetical protein
LTEKTVATLLMGAGKQLLPPHPNPLPHWGRGDKEGNAFLLSLITQRLSASKIKPLSASKIKPHGGQCPPYINFAGRQTALDSIPAGTAGPHWRTGPGQSGRFGGFKKIHSWSRQKKLRFFHPSRLNEITGNNFRRGMAISAFRMNYWHRLSNYWSQAWIARIK